MVHEKTSRNLRTNSLARKVAGRIMMGDSFLNSVIKLCGDEGMPFVPLDLSESKSVHNEFQLYKKFGSL